MKSGSSRGSYERVVVRSESGTRKRLAPDDKNDDPGPCSDTEVFYGTPVQTDMIGRILICRNNLNVKWSS